MGAMGLAQAMRSQPAGYASSVAIPVALTYTIAWLGWPAFIFEHVVILLVAATALRWGLGPAVVTAIVSVTSDNVLLRDPIGRPTITGYRDVLDLLLFAAVAVIVSELLRRAQMARASRRARPHASGKLERSVTGSSRPSPTI
jgi:K+-sensing histidine kinase KdpD